VETGREVEIKGSESEELLVMFLRSQHRRSIILFISPPDIYSTVRVHGLQWPRCIWPCALVADTSHNFRIAPFHTRPPVPRRTNARHHQIDPSPSVGYFPCYCGLLFQLCLVLLCHSQATVASRSAPFDRVWPHPAGSAAQYCCFEGQRPNSRHSFMLAVKE
jgi:hypothetical protein